MAVHEVTLADAGEMITMALEYRAEGGKLYDNLTKHSMVLETFSRKAKSFDGGRSLNVSHEFEENPSFNFYKSAEHVSLDAARMATMTQYEMKEAAIAVTITNRELLLNGGRSQVIDMLEARTENAEKTFHNQMSKAMFETGAAFGGRAITGLRTLVADDGEGVVGGIDASDHAWWQNQNINAGNLTRDNVQGFIADMIQRCVRNGDETDTILTTRAIYLLIEAAIQQQYRQTTADTGRTSFKHLMVQGHVLSHDHYCTDKRMYFVNHEYMTLRPHARQNFRPLGDERMSPSQTVATRLMVWAGQFTVGNRSLQGVMKTN